MCARAKGDGCLVKRGAVYHARWVVDGHVYTRSTKCTKRSDAAKKLAQYVHPYQVSSEIETLENLQAKINVLDDERKRTPKEKAIRLAMMMDALSKDVNQSPLTAKSYHEYDCKCNVFARFFASKVYCYAITQRDAEAFLLWLKTKVSPITYNSYLSVLRRIWDVMMKQDSNIRKNPFADIHDMRISQASNRRELTNDEINKLIATAYESSDELGLFFKIGAYTGMRRIDVACLQLKDIDRDNRIIRKLPRKTKRTGIMYRIPIVTELSELITLIGNPDDYVFPHLHKICNSRLTKVIRDVFAKSGIDIIQRDANGHIHYVTGFHAFRHTLASKLHRNGTPVNQIKTILGHSKIDRTLYYAHVEESDLKMPDMTGDTKRVDIKLATYATIMSYTSGDDIETALHAILQSVRAKKEVTEERKKREAEIMTKLLDDRSKNEKLIADNIRMRMMLDKIK